MRAFCVGLTSSILLSTVYVNGQSTGPQTIRILPYELSFLTFAPDARSAGMGETGVATTPDANAMYWNASKLAFIESDFGASISYTPWLRTIMDDLWLGYASAFKRLGKRQVVSASVNSYNYSQDFAGIGSNRKKGRDLAFSAAYTRQIGAYFSMAVTLKYVSSDFMPGSSAGISINPVRTIAGDLGAYYTNRKKDVNTGRERSWSLGAVISDFGNKVRYNQATGSQYIPTTFKIGGGVSLATSRQNRFNFALDARKMLIPTPGLTATTNNRPLLSGMARSFSDAPDGFREELSEVALSAGAEYWYKNTFAFRGGYSGESRLKGNRDYFTTGAGVRLLKRYNADISYLIPAVKGSPMARTFRMSLAMYLGDKQRQQI